MIGAYFVSKQSAAGSIYNDVLPSAGKTFIDKTKLLEAVGLSRDVVVIDINFLLDEVMGQHQPLDWPSFVHNDKLQPLHVVTSSLRSMRSLTFTSSNNSSSSGGRGCDWTEQSLLSSIRASMNVPGVAGSLMAVSSAQPVPHPLSPDATGVDDDDKAVEALADAFLAEPMPYRSAVADGATHCLVLRTRPDPSPILGKRPGLYERVICRRFFRRHGCTHAAEWVFRQQHHRIYAEDLTLLNDAARGPAQGVSVSGKFAHLLAVAPSRGRLEVSQLENRKSALLQGMRDGARRTLQIFLPALLAAAAAGEGGGKGGGEGGGEVGGEGGEAATAALVDEMVDMIFPIATVAKTSRRVPEEVRSQILLEMGHKIV